MAGLAVSKSQHIKSKRTLLDMMRESKWLFMGLFIGPAILLILIVVVVPMLYSLYLSFTDYNLLDARNSAFIGIQNYIELFKDKVFIISFVRTFVFMTLTVNLELLFGLLIALLLSKPLKGESFLRIILMVPMMFPPILVGFQFKWIFNDQAGLLNNLLYSLTGQLHQIPWLIDQPYGFLSILVAELWMGTPFMAIILLAGMMSLPKEPFEAADIDGASGFQKFYYITRPMLMPYMLIAMAIRSLDISRAYDLVKIMTNGGPAQRTELIWTYVTRLSIVDSKFAMGCAMSFVSVLISFAFTIMIYKQLIAARRGLG